MSSGNDPFAGLPVSFDPYGIAQVQPDEAFGRADLDNVVRRVHHQYRDNHEHALEWEEIKHGVAFLEEVFKRGHERDLDGIRIGARGELVMSPTLAAIADAAYEKPPRRPREADDAPKLTRRGAFRVAAASAGAVATFFSGRSTVRHIGKAGEAAEEVDKMERVLERNPNAPAPLRKQWEDDRDKAQAEREAHNGNAVISGALALFSGTMAISVHPDRALWNFQDAADIRRKRPDENAAVPAVVEFLKVLNRGLEKYHLEKPSIAREGY